MKYLQTNIDQYSSSSHAINASDMVINNYIFKYVHYTSFKLKVAGIFVQQGNTSRHMSDMMKLPLKLHRSENRTLQLL